MCLFVRSIRALSGAVTPIGARDARAVITPEPALEARLRRCACAKEGERRSEGMIWAAMVAVLQSFSSRYRDLEIHVQKIDECKKGGRSALRKQGRFNKEAPKV